LPAGRRTRRQLESIEEKIETIKKLHEKGLVSESQCKKALDAYSKQSTK